MGRIQEIFARVGRRLKDEGQRSYQLEDFLSDLYAAEKDIVGRAGLLEQKLSIALLAGVDSYTLAKPIGTVSGFLHPKWWRGELEIVMDVNQWAEKVRSWEGRHSPNPRFCHVWDDTIEFAPAPSKDDTLVAFGTLAPEKLEIDDEDPSLPLEWDRAIEFGVMADLAGGDYKVDYLRELQLQIGHMLAGKARGVQQVSSNIRDLGY